MVRGRERGEREREREREREKDNKVQVLCEASPKPPNNSLKWLLKPIIHVGVQHKYTSVVWDLE